MNCSMTASPRGVKPITDREYYVSCTALLTRRKDHNKIINAQKHTAEEERAEHVLS